MIQKNNLGNISELYKSVILDENNMRYTSRTIYFQGEKELAFEVIYSQGIKLIIESSRKETMDLQKIFNYEDIYTDSFGYNIGQPIFADYDYKFIITDLDTIKVVNKVKGINKVVWKR